MIKNFQLSKNFMLYDYLKSPTAERFPLIKEQQFNPSKEIVENLVQTNGLLQKVRDFYKLPIRITSGYRCEDLNTLIGGSKTSDHCIGGAVDFELLNESGQEAGGKDYRRVAMFVFQQLEFDQLIKEFGTAKCPAWLHISNRFTAKGKNRRMALEIGRHTNNKYVPLSFSEWKP